MKKGKVMDTNKKMDVWVLSIEDSGDPAESWVYNTHEQAVAKLREFFLDLAKGAWDAQKDYVDLSNLETPEDIVSDSKRIDDMIARTATVLMSVEELMPKPGATINAEVLWDNRVVWLEKHTLRLAARKEWAADGVL
jgi:hypothetical protein